jgi:ribonuclease HIII
MGQTIQIPEEKFDAFKAYLKRIGFNFEEKPHQVFLARYPGLVVSLYNSGNIVLGGKDELLKREILFFIETNGGKIIEKPKKEAGPSFVGRTRIGTDEVGKGDYFGPLVVSGVLIDEEDEKKLKEIGVRDSKNLSDTTISDIAIKIRKILGRSNYEEIWIGPKKYNILQSKLKNVNKIHEKRKKDRSYPDATGGS